MVGVGRSDNQHIWIREKRDEDSGIAGRDDHHLVSHAGPRQHASKLSRRERLREPPRLDCQAGWEPCEVRIKNRMSFSASNPLAATCNDLARASIVALPPFLELYCTSIGPVSKRFATTCAAPAASLLNTPWSPKRPKDTTPTL